jgi:hypothetical protein
MSWAWGYRPVEMDARLGEQSGVGHVAAVNRVPSRAMRSMFGVSTGPP